MPLQKQLINYNFEQGLDEKTDPKLTQNLTTLENAIFQKRFTLQKRYGYEETGKEIIGGGLITTGAALGQFNNELLMFSDQKVFSYAAANDRWVNKGSAVSVSIETREVIRNNYSQENPDNSIVSGVQVVAWEDGRGGVRATVFDNISELALLSDYELSPGASHVKTIGCGGYNFVYYMDGSILKVRRLDPANPTTFSSEATLRTDGYSTYSDIAYDATVIGSNMLVTYRNNTGTITLMYVTQNMVVGNPLVGLPNAITFAGDAENLSIEVYDEALIVVAHQSVTDGVVIDSFYLDFTPYAGPSQIDNSTTATNPCTNLTQVRVVDPLYPQNIYVYYSSESIMGSDISIRFQQYDYVNNMTVFTLQTFLLGVALYAKPYIHDNRIFIPVAYDSPEQSTYFVVRDDGFITAKIASNNGGGIPTNNLLAEVSSNGPNVYEMPILVKGKLQSEQGVLYTNTGVADVIIDHNDQDIFSAEQLGQNTLIAGGYLKMYDGDTVVEQGFHLYPEGITATASPDPGNMSDGTYLYRVMWEWVDAKGQIHRSAPSTPVSITLSGGGSSQSVDIDVPTLKLTQKQFPRVAPVIVVYRTENGGQVYYRVTSPLSPTFNDIYQDTITINDSLADTDIIANEILYTTGGVLENIAPPACTILQVFKNRLFLAGLENPNQIWYSNEQIQGEGLNFNDLLQITVDTTGGRITALSVLDDKLVIFKELAIFVLAGDGPNLTGGQNDYTKPQLVNSDVGCIDSNSAVITPEGVMFKSTKGIYLINRSLQTSYIGSPVESYNADQVVRSVLVQNRNEVRFLLATDVVLVYNYYFKQWSVFANYNNGVDATIYGGEFTYLTTEGDVRQETTGTFFDNGSNIQMKIVTPWFSFAGLQGYQRIYRVFLIGKFKSQHILRVRIGYDFKSSWQETILINTNDLFGTTTFGSESPYGTESGGTWANELEVYQFQFDVTTQKCQSIRFEISDTSSTGDGQGFELTGLAFEVGVKQGGNKIPVSQKFSGS